MAQQPSGADVPWRPDEDAAQATEAAEQAIQATELERDVRSGGEGVEEPDEEEEDGGLAPAAVSEKLQALLRRNLILRVHRSRVMPAGRLSTVSTRERPSGRVGHTVINMKGRLLSVGGSFFRPRALERSVLEFDWRDCEWRGVRLTGHAHQLFRTGASVIPYLDRYLVMFGGFIASWGSSHRDDVVLIDMEKNMVLDESVIKVTGPRPHPRDKHAAVCFDERMYVFGGWGAEVPDEEGFEPAGMEENLAISCGWNNTLFSMDLTPLRAWDGVSELTLSWQKETPAGTPPRPRAAHTAVLYGDTMVIFGGRTRPSRTNDFHGLHIPSMEWSGPWEMTGDPISKRSWQCAAFVAPHYLFLQGGLGVDRHSLSDAFIVNLRERSVKRLPNHRPNLWHSATYVEPFVYYFGGSSSSDPRQNMNSALYRCRPLPPTLVERCLEVMSIIPEESFKHVRPHIPAIFLPSILERRYTFLRPSACIPVRTDGS